MEESVDTGRIVRIVALVLLASIGASFGFNALTTNPLVPDADLSIADAPAPARLNESGSQPMLTITHEGGDTIPVDALVIVVGSRSEGLTFSAGNNWTASVSGVTYRVQLNGAEIQPAAAFGPGDTLVVLKSTGTLQVPGFESLVRVFHTPSDTAIARRTVTIE